MQAAGQSRGATPGQPQSTSPPFPKPPLHAAEAARMGMAPSGAARRKGGSNSLGPPPYGGGNPFEGVLDGAFANSRMPAASGGARDA